MESSAGMLMMVVATALAVLAVRPPSVAGAVSGPSPSPAPGKAPAHVDLSQLLSVAGPFSTFLSYLESTKVIDTFQKQANESVTLFVPTDGAFSSLKPPAPSLGNLTSEQLKSLCLFHGLPQYYSLSDFSSLSQLRSPVATLAGGEYTLNFTDVSGSVHITSGWSNTKVSSSVLSTSPVAIYEVSKVLLPEAIFGTDIPAPVPAPAPAPQTSVAADSPARSPSTSSSSHSTSSAPQSTTALVVSLLFAVISGGLVYINFYS